MQPQPPSLSSPGFLSNSWPVGERTRHAPPDGGPSPLPGLSKAGCVAQGKVSAFSEYTGCVKRHLKSALGLHKASLLSYLTIYGKPDTMKNAHHLCALELLTQQNIFVVYRLFWRQYSHLSVYIFDTSAGIIQEEGHTEPFSCSFLLQCPPFTFMSCLPLFFSREGFSRPILSSTVRSICTNSRNSRFCINV